MKHFTISEMLKSDTALKMRLWNGAPKEAEDNLKLAQMIAESGKFDQIILEEVGANDLLPRWIHVSYRRLGWNRKLIMKKVAGKPGYIMVPLKQLAA